MTAVSLLSFGGDQGWQLWSFWVQVVILPHASLSLPALWFYSVTLSCWTACVPGSKYKGSCSCDWKQLPFSQGGKKKAIEPVSLQSTVRIQRSSSEPCIWEARSVSLCLCPQILSMHGRCSWVAAAFIHQGCSLGGMVPYLARGELYLEM